MVKTPLGLRLPVVALCAVISGCAFMQNLGGQVPLSSAASSLDSTPYTKPPSPAFAHSPEELEAFIGKWTVGYQPAPETLNGQLAGFSPMPIPVTRGQCYRVVVRLGPGAALSEHAKTGLQFIFRSTQGEPEVNTGPGFHGPGGVAALDCPQQSGTLLLDIYAHVGSATDTSRVHDLGQGAFTVQIYTKVVSDAVLNQQAAAEQQDRAEQQSRRQEGEAAQCSKCRTQQAECLDGRHRPSLGNCTNEYRNCVESYSIRLRCP